jgi:hypothetical protein
MRESTIEDYLCERVKELGGRAKKMKGKNDPDRLVLLPHGEAVFVELKAPGERPTNAQAREHNRLVALGFKVYVIDCISMVDYWFSK